MYKLDRLTNLKSLGSNGNWPFVMDQARSTAARPLTSIFSRQRAACRPLAWLHLNWAQVRRLGPEPEGLSTGKSGRRNKSGWWFWS